MPANASKTMFPQDLVDWSGHRSGGVRRLFDMSSGRPTGKILRTRLLEKLARWASDVGGKAGRAPQAILLVGGPGNGKTEAVEFTIGELDSALGAGGQLSLSLAAQFKPIDGKPAPRLARAQVPRFGGSEIQLAIDIVQDASADDDTTHTPAARALIQDLESLLLGGSDRVYLACVNRGILDDALIAATDDGRLEVRELLEAIVRSVGMEHDAPACWPLQQFDAFGVWAMDVESLVGDSLEGGGIHSPASDMLELALDAAHWPEYGSCAAGERCPFCISRQRLINEPHRSSFLKILRWYELASGKRWTFRDLFSLVSFLLAGMPPDKKATSGYNPCQWAAALLMLSEQPAAKATVRYRAPYDLVACLYQHTIFGLWPTLDLRLFRSDLAELKLTDSPALMGLYYFLTHNRGHSIPPTLGAQLNGISEALDPALADPDMKVEVSGNSTITFREIDMRFSQSVSDGLAFIQRYKCLSTLEIALLKGLALAEQQLLSGDQMSQRPAVGMRVLSRVRDFACRLVRRAVGVRSARVQESDVLANFQQVVRGDATLLHEAAKQVEHLLNDKDRFVVNLSTTFGEPLPPAQRRAVLITAKQKVKVHAEPSGERPQLAVRFLSVGSSEFAQSIPLTYELFRSVAELRKGMAPASLPRAVIALLDTTRARLAGQIVRNEEALDGAEIRIGTRDDVLAYELGRFLVRREEVQ